MLRYIRRHRRLSVAWLLDAVPPDGCVAGLNPGLVVGRIAVFCGILERVAFIRDGRCCYVNGWDFQGPLSGLLGRRHDQLARQCSSQA
jgi:hypothetical protein